MRGMPLKIEIYNLTIYRIYLWRLNRVRTTDRVNPKKKPKIPKKKIYFIPPKIKKKSLMKLIIMILLYIKYQ
jgi:hypothetical protein